MQQEVKMEQNKKDGKTLTRRNFLKTAGATAAVAGLATSGMALTPWSAEAAALPKKWDETYDVVVIGSGFAGLAAAYDIPAGPLKETIEKWNKSVLAGKDEEWGRYLQKNQKPLGPGPWYALRLTPKIHHCMGGLNINTNAQALDVMTDKPIPGLYAAGEVTGGVHGAVRLGSCATLDCLIFGRIAGQNAAKDKSWG